MSDRLKNTNQTSNEEIIEDLTKGLENSLNTTENVPEFLINPSTSAEKAPLESGDAANIPENNSAPFETDYLDPDEKDPESDTDSIDETSLKDAEMDLTDDQKEEKRIIVEELKQKGNEAFKIEDYECSVEKYTLGLQTCPLQFSQLRAILYCNRSAARMKQLKYDRAIKDCSKAIELDDKYLKAYIRRAQSYEAKEKLDESLADYKKILELDPSHKEAQKAVIRLPPLIDEKNEKLKAEMLGKLKDLGNMILKPFGLSTSNFQMEQDPEKFTHNMARCKRRRRRKRKMCRTRCRGKSGRFKRCRSCDRRYPVRQPSCRPRRRCSRRRCSCRRRRRPTRCCSMSRSRSRCRSRS